MSDIFLPAVLMRGLDYQQNGYVLNIRLSEGLLKARVKGSSNQIYNVHLDLKTWPSTPARCSCPYQSNCKHAAASLFALQEKENYQIPAPTEHKADHSLNAWLSSLRDKEAQENTLHSTHQIVYLVDPQLGEHEDRIAINLGLAKQLKKAKLGKKQVFNTITESRKQHFKGDDEDIIASLLFKNNTRQWFNQLFIRNSELFEKILTTKRAYLANDKEPLLELGEEVHAQLEWHLTPDGTQQLVLKAENQILTVLILDKIWCFDLPKHQFRPVNSPYKISQLKQLLSAPSVQLKDAAIIAQQFAETDPSLPKPEIYESAIVEQKTPAPLLVFSAHEAEEGLQFCVDLSFDYEGLIIPCGETKLSFFRKAEHRLIEIKRDLAFEERSFNELKEMIALQKSLAWEECNRGNRFILRDFQEGDLAQLYAQTIPVLKSKGWLIEFAHPIYEDMVDATELEWFSDLREEGEDFFSYQLGILVDGNPVDVVPLVADLINRMGKERIEKLADEELIKLSLPQGKLLQVKLGRIKPLLQFILQYGYRFNNKEKALEINRYQLILMQETEKAMACISKRWHFSELLQQQLQQLIHLSTLPLVEIPKGLKATLRDYQHQGLNWLQFLRHCRFGGVLADDMGLGKTVQTLAHLLFEKEQNRLKTSLIIAPTSLVGNWFNEAKRFSPELKVLIFHGLERHQDQFEDYDLIISTYGLIQRDKRRFTEFPFYYLILDEAQSIKNARTKTTQIIQQMQAEHRLCLSGTPLENHLGELWSLFHFLMPGLLGDVKQFRQFFRTPIEKLDDPEKRTLLAKRVQPFMLRRSKDQVVKELPLKTETTLTIELTGSQRDLYEAIRISMEKKVREAIHRQGLGKSHIVLLDALLKLRQVCCDPKLLKIPEAEIAHTVSAKLDALTELLDNLIQEGRRVLVFSQFTSMLELIEKELTKRHYAYLKLTGQTQNRQSIVDTFQEGKVPIFLISLKAGGTGLNLTRADTVIHYDPWWNPAVENQATDRSHRIGQENPVFVYKLIASGTVEEAILSMQQRKRQLFDGILGDNVGNLGNLTKDDIEHFFQPLTKE